MCDQHSEIQFQAQGATGLEFVIREAFDNPKMKTWQEDWCGWCLNDKYVKRWITQLPSLADEERKEFGALAAKLLDRQPESGYPVFGGAVKKTTFKQKRVWDVVVNRIWPVGELPWATGDSGGSVSTAYWTLTGVDRNGYIHRCFPPPEGGIIEMKPGYVEDRLMGSTPRSAATFGGGILSNLRLHRVLTASEPISLPAHFTYEEVEFLRKSDGSFSAWKNW